jgi:hypothetical protein
MLRGMVDKPPVPPRRCTIVETGKESYRLREARRLRRAEARRRQAPVDAGPAEV